MGQDLIKSLCMKISGQTNMGGVVVGICYWFADQQDTNEASSKN